MPHATHSEADFFLNCGYDVEGALKWVEENGTPLEQVVIWKALWEYAEGEHIPDPYPNLRLVRHRLQKKLTKRFKI